jgi:hypothetical protein
MSSYTIETKPTEPSAPRMFTAKAAAVAEARAIAEAYGQTLDSVRVVNAGGVCVYHLRRSPEGDGATWYVATPPGPDGRDAA